MTHRKLPAFLLVAAFLIATTALGQGAYKATAGGAPDAAIPANMRAQLAQQGVTFSGSQGEICEIWWRNGIPVGASASSSGDTLYGGLSVGEFLGVLHFPSAAQDYRAQAIKPGYYTLRYALIPQDGNHMGVSSYRDFILLIPIADDSNPAENMTFDAVVKASRLSTSTGHPAVLMLDPPKQGANSPSAAQDDQGDWALNVKLDVKSSSGAAAQLPFAVVLVGQYQG